MQKKKLKKKVRKFRSSSSKTSTTKIDSPDVGLFEIEDGLRKVGRSLNMTQSV
jgi:hypothetical protein